MDLLLDKMPLFLLFPMLSPGFGDKGLSAKTQPPWLHKAGLQFNINRVSGVGRLRPSSEPHSHYVAKLRVQTAERLKPALSHLPFLCGWGSMSAQ